MHGELFGLLGTLCPLPWCVHGDCPLVDREFCWTRPMQPMVLVSYKLFNILELLILMI